MIVPSKCFCAALFKLFNVSSTCQNEVEDSGNCILVYPREQWHASNSFSMKSAFRGET